MQDMSLVPALVRWFALVAMATLTLAQERPKRDRTFAVDAVQLQRGKEEQGRSEFAVQRGKFTYLFATEANRDEFVEEPARYEIQWGGACGRMGPLSGEGSVNLHAVHDKKLFLFASEQCRTAFLKAPHLMLEGPDPELKPNAQASERGRALLAKAVTALGGAARIDAVRTYFQRQELDVASGARTYRVVKAKWIDFAGNFRSEESWDASGWATVRSGGAAFTLPGGEDLAESQASAFEREMGHVLIAVLRSRNRDGAVVQHRGAGKVGAQEIEYVTLSCAGTNRTLGIDPNSGRVLSLGFRGRGPNSTVGRVEHRYADWRKVGELELPFAWSAVFEGDPAPELAVALDTIEIDRTPPAELFQRK